MSLASSQNGTKTNIQNSDQADGSALNKLLLDQLSSYQAMLLQMQAEVQRLKQSEAEEEAKIKEDDQIILDGGIQDLAQIKEEFLALQAENPELHAYCQTFYWTSLNLFDGYRYLSTQLVEASSVNTSTDKLWLTMVSKVAQYGADFAKGTPIVGGALSLLDKIIDSIYTGYQTTAIGNKINSINLVIQHKFGMAEEISLNIAKTAIAIVKAKKEAILHPETNNNHPGKLQAAFDWLKNQVTTIKDKILPHIDLHDKDSHGAQLALQDTTLFMAYLSVHYQQVIDGKQTLDHRDWRHYFKRDAR